MKKNLFYFGMFHTYKEALLKENIKRVQKFSVIIVILEAMFLLATFITPALFPASLILNYRVHYYVLLAGATSMYIISKLFERYQQFHKLFAFLCYLALTTSLLWGMSLTLLDLRTSDNMVVYLTFVFITSFVFVVRPEITIVILTTVQGLFMYFLSDYPNWISNGINSLVFVVFAWFVSRYQYYLLSERLRRDDLIDEKNDALEKQNLELIRLMMKDHLTGTYNRYSLDDILAKRWMEAYIHQVKITVLMIDIDYFKKYNDTFGHIKGDQCLGKVGELLNEVAENFDGYAFRYGGDEFCMLFSDLLYLDAVVTQIDNGAHNIDLDTGMSIQLSIGVLRKYLLVMMVLGIASIKPIRNSIKLRPKETEGKQITDVNCFLFFAYFMV